MKTTLVCRKASQEFHPYVLVVAEPMALSHPLFSDRCP